MNIEVAKEMIDWFLMRACLFALVVLSGFFLFVVLSRVLIRLKAAAKRYGWPIVSLFIVFSSWATYTAFPTAEEKNGSPGSGVRGLESEVDTNSTVHLNSSLSPKLSPNSYPLTPNPCPLSLTQEDFARGFVLTRIGTNEVHDFTSPLGASICEDWKAFGAAEDWVYLEGSGVSSQGLGRERLRVHSDGWVTVLSPTSTVFAAREYYPFKAPLGIVPEALLTPNPYPLTPNSCFWHHLTTSNTLQLTWQNVLYNRESDLPISFQVEFYENGDFTYRYDLSAIKAKIDSGVIPENFPSNIIIGTIPHSLLLVPQSPFPTSLVFRHLDSSDTTGSDRDGDGLIIEDELFVYYTDPYNVDSDYDGLSDYDEIFTVKSNPLDAYSISNDYYDGFASVLNGEDPFSYPQGSTNTVLEHVFYSGSTNGVFSLPVSTDQTAVLKVCVSGSGIGRLVVGEKVVPLVAPMKQRSVAVTNTLLLAVGKGVKKSIWFTKSEELELAIDSDDFMIGELPSLFWPHGWIAFPHTEATVPCIHDFNGKGRIVTLLYGEEFLGMTASWSSGTSDVVITNVAPVSAEIYGHFKKNQTREISYRVNHPKQLNTAIAHFTQTLRFCPQFTEDEEPPEELPEEDEDDRYWDCMCGVNAPCFCGEDEWCFCYSPDCRCNENRSPTIIDNEDDEVEFENILEELTPSVNALYLYRDNERTVHLEVPDGEPRRCCPCPEHWKSNYVSKVLYTSRLSVNDAVGDDFNISYEPCSVTVSGVSPSRSFRDSTVSFITNGIAYKRLDYTVLGVKISRGEWDIPFETYNRLSPQLGFPFEVCTDINNAERFYLDTDVLMTNGYVRISLEDVTGEFKVWLPEWYDTEGNWHDCETLLDSETKRVRHMSMSQWKNILRRYWETTSLEVRVTSSAAGSCKLKLEYLAADGDRYIHDFAEQRITSLNPLLLVDYNRDGKIDLTDVGDSISGRNAYFWRNDDEWKNDDAFDASFFGQANASDSVVNGRNDLINFLPIAVDVKTLTSQWNSNDFYFRLESYSSQLRKAQLLYANISHSRIGDAALGNDIDINGISTHEASVFSLGEGSDMPPIFVGLSHFGKSTLLVEFPECYRYGAFYLNIYSKSDNKRIYSSKINLHIGEIDKMIGWLNIRSAAGGSDGVPTRLATPDWPESEHKTGNLVFVHGYNMAEDAETPLWAKNVFKKLWWAGLDRGFIAVQWRGNETQTFMPGVGFVTPNYYCNVQNAFATASSLKTVMDDISGPKWFLAHSLGNMLVSAAIEDCQMPHEKYFMLNAAVAMEAYEPVAGITQESHDNMTPAEWTSYPDRVRATHWYELFPEGDGRRLLTWKGRFSNVTNIVNFYSTQEEVVNNGDGGEHSLTDRNYVWYNQETRKGNWTMMLHVNEGGWVFNDYYGTLLSHLQPDEANALSNEVLQQKPFFQDFANEEIYSSTNGVLVATNYLYRAEMLAYAIPSESYAVGANPLPGRQTKLKDSPSESLYVNYDMGILFANGIEDLPVNEDKPEKRHRDWQHSTFVQRSYKRTHQLFKTIMGIIREL